MGKVFESTGSVPEQLRIRVFSAMAPQACPTPDSGQKKDQLVRDTLRVCAAIRRRCLAIAQALEMLGVARALHGNFGGRAFDFAEILAGQLDVRRS